MNQIYICSDLHFCHNKEFLYIPRGFNSIEEHNIEIVKRWNSIVEHDDIVYVLGDVIMSDIQKGMEYLSQLNGQIYIIPGNHDSANKISQYITLPNVQVLSAICGGLQPMAAMLKYKKYYIYLSHFPTLCSNIDDNDKPLKTKVINICGHSHVKNKFEDMDKGIIYHVEMDAHNCYPVNIDTIIDEIKEYIKCHM